MRYVFGPAIYHLTVPVLAFRPVFLAPSGAVFRILSPDGPIHCHVERAKRVETSVSFRPTKKSPSAKPRGIVLRTGIELYVYITYKWICKQLQKIFVIGHPVSQKAVLREIECSRWLSQMKRRFFRDVSPHLRERPLRHLLLPWQSWHFPSIHEDYVPC